MRLHTSGRSSLLYGTHLKAVSACLLLLAWAPPYWAYWAEEAAEADGPPAERAKRELELRKPGDLSAGFRHRASG